jgi:hypothetical protein
MQLLVNVGEHDRRDVTIDHETHYYCHLWADVHELNTKMVASSDGTIGKTPRYHTTDLLLPPPPPPNRWLTITAINNFEILTVCSPEAITPLFLFLELGSVSLHSYWTQFKKQKLRSNSFWSTNGQKVSHQCL